MENIRFEIKIISDGNRELTEDEKYFLKNLLSNSLHFSNMGDDLVPDRSIISTKPGVEARALGGSLGIGEGPGGDSTERKFDDFFREYFSEGCYLWVEAMEKGEVFEPLIWAPYSAERRDWLYMYGKLENGGLPCGMTSVDGRLSVFAELDSNFTMIFGEKNEVLKFDSKFGGRQRLRSDFVEFCRESEVNFGHGNIYGYLEKYVSQLV